MVSSPALTLVEALPAVEARSLRLRRRLWLVYLGALGALSLAYLFGPKLINSGPVFNAIGISAVVAVLVGVRLNGITHKLPWYLFALAQALFVTGDVIAYNYQRIFHRALPFPSIADGFYLAFYPVLIAGILLLIRRRLPGRDAAGLIDSLIITIGVGVVSWVFLIAPYAHDGTLTLPTKLTSIAYPLMDILVLSVIVRLAMGGGRRERSFLLLLIGSVSLLVTDAIYGYLLLHGGYTTGGLLDGGWIAFYLLLGAAALHPSVASLADAPRDPVTKLTRTRLAALAAASLAAPAVQAGEYLAGNRIDVPLIAAGGAVLYLLVVARMAGLMRQQTRSEARFSSLVRNSSDVVAVVAVDTTFRYVSPSAERVFGYPSGALEGTRFIDLVHADDTNRVLHLFSSLQDVSATHPLIECTISKADGSWLEVEAVPTCLLDDPSVSGIVLNTRDVSERKAFERQLERHAFYDSITGLANRALFTDRIVHALDHAERTRAGVAVIFMDLDDFKIVNDTFGHAAGDELLREVGDRLRSCARSCDTAARLGGDEFAILLEDTDGDSGPAEVAERIRIALEPPFFLDSNQMVVRASLGIAFGDGRRGPQATADLMRNADVAMYMAKAQGKSRCEVYQPTMHKTMLERLELKSDLRRALEQDEFVLHYQPLITLGTGEVAGHEALVRWQHPARGLVPPLDFIPLAEETGLIMPLGTWVLETACREARRLQDRYAQPKPLSMSVNLSARQLQWPGIVDDVKRVLAETGLDPETLIIEVTESAMMQDVELSVLRLAELREIGVRVAIDDFGAGYSSLGYIRQLPIDILKVDKSFIDHIDEGAEQLALAAAIIDMAKVLSLVPVAERVERSGQLDELLRLGCDCAQGYYFAKPALGAQVEQLLARRKHVAA